MGTPPLLMSHLAKLFAVPLYLVGVLAKGFAAPGKARGLMCPLAKAFRPPSYFVGVLAKVEMVVAQYSAHRCQVYMSTHANSQPCRSLPSAMPPQAKLVRRVQTQHTQRKSHFHACEASAPNVLCGCEMVHALGEKVLP
eukprot:7356725-Prymnesium_polylepis.2